MEIKWKKDDGSLLAWLQAGERKQDINLTDDEIVGHIFNLYWFPNSPHHPELLSLQIYRLAGSGTKANTLIVVLYHLVKHHDVHRKLVEEIDEYYRANTDSEQCASGDVRHLPYL